MVDKIAKAMAIIESSKKRIKINRRNRRRNLTYLNKIKSARKALEKASGKKDKQAALSKAYKAVDKAVKKNIIHQNKGARLKSQFSKKAS